MDQQVPSAVGWFVLLIGSIVAPGAIVPVEGAEARVETRVFKKTPQGELEPHPLKPADFGTVEITLIPYYAWANRSVSYMEVWIPLAR